MSAQSSTAQYVAVQSAIAALAVPGLRKIYTSANVPVEMFSRLCPAMIPDPDTPLISSESNPLTLGGRGWTRPRTLAYVVLTAEVGELRGAFTHGQRLAECWDNIENKLCDFQMAGIHRSGPIVLEGAYPLNDHSGKAFFGFRVRFTYLTSY